MFKKISLIVATILLVTIGGVYASWVYANGAVQQVEQQNTVTLTDKVVDTAKGTIEVTPNAVAPTITIDDSGNYVPKFVATGAYDVKFTKDAHSAVNSLHIQCVVSVVSTLYPAGNGKQIFTLKDDGKIDLGNINSGDTKQLTTADIIAKITLIDTPLNTPEEYVAFQTELAKCKINLTFSEFAA